MDTGELAQQERATWIEFHLLFPRDPPTRDVTFAAHNRIAVLQNPGARERKSDIVFSAWIWLDK